MTSLFFRALGVSVSLSAVAVFATETVSLLTPGVWKSTVETTVVTAGGAKPTAVGKTENTYCLSPAFVATNPYFNAEAALGTQSTKAQSCRYWPIAETLTSKSGVLRMRFECKTTNDSLMWATVDNTGTPNATQTKLRVFREGGAGYVEIVNQMTRIDEPCTKDMRTIEARPEGKTQRDPKPVAVSQPAVDFLGETFFYDGVEMAGTATHNNYYRAEESSTDWRKEFSTSHYPHTASTDAYIALIAASEQRPLLKGTKIQTLAKSSDGKDITISQLVTNKRSDGQAFVLHSVARILQRPDFKGVKIYRLETDHDTDKLPSTQALGDISKRYAEALARIELPVYNAEGRAPASSVSAIKPVMFNGQSYRFDTGTVTLTHIFNGYVPDDSDANVAPRSLWVNVYPTADTTKDVIEWTKEDFKDKLLKGSKFESLIKAADGSTETLLYLLPTHDEKGFEMSIARFTKDADGVKIYRYQDTFAGTLVEQAANVRASMRKLAALLAELNIPIVNEERTSPFARVVGAN